MTEKQKINNVESNDIIWYLLYKKVIVFRNRGIKRIKRQNIKLNHEMEIEKNKIYRYYLVFIISQKVKKDDIY